MVLAELGSKIQTALAKMGQATVIDEKVLDDLVSPNSLTPLPPYPVTPAYTHLRLSSFFFSHLPTPPSLFFSLR